MSTLLHLSSFFFFFFNDTATTEIYTLSLHDALPIYPHVTVARETALGAEDLDVAHVREPHEARKDRKSTRLNSSHGYISYAVFCLKKKKPKETERRLCLELPAWDPHPAGRRGRRGGS